MKERTLYVLIIIVVILFVILIICRNRVFGEALECTSKKLFPKLEIIKLPQIQLKYKSNSFRTFNPSITTLNGTPLLTYRVSNSTKCTNLPNKDALLSKFDKDIILNHIVIQIPKNSLLNGNFITIKTENVSSEGCVQGFEDPRSIISPDGKTLYLVVNNRSASKCNAEMWMIRLSTDIFSDPKVLKKEEYFAKDVVKMQMDKPRIGAQKNWMPFFLENVKTDDMFFVYSVNPHIILRCNTKTGKCSTFAETFNPRLPTDIRGGSQIRFYNGRYIGLTHVRRNSESYITQAYAFSDQYPYEVEAITQPFIFDENDEFNNVLIQFVSGFEIIDDIAFITYGEQDCNSKLCKIPMKSLMKSLYEIEPPTKGSILLKD